MSPCRVDFSGAPGLIGLASFGHTLLVLDTAKVEGQNARLANDGPSDSNTLKL